jgi:Pyrroline-5-carboxylate reductase
MLDPLKPAAERGVVLLGCGKMGGAMLEGWLAAGLPPERAAVIDPSPPEWLQARGVPANGALSGDPAAIVLAVKSQMMPDALPRIADLGGPDCLVLSIARRPAARHGSPQRPPPPAPESCARCPNTPGGGRTLR